MELTKKLLLSFIALAVLLVPTASLAQLVEIEGEWLAENGGKVEIKPCEETWCGYISEVAVPPDIYEKNKESIDAIGMQNLTDRQNKDPELRERLLVGLKIFTVTGWNSDGSLSGDLYNPEDGNNYEGILKIHSESSIELAGCVFFNLLCRSEVWERVVIEE